MSENKAKLNDSLKEKVAPKNFKKNPIKGTKFTLMISSAKGGVGKSTFAINLAFTLQKKGKKVGLLDAESVVNSPSLVNLLFIPLDQLAKVTASKSLILVGA